MQDILEKLMTLGPMFWVIFIPFFLLIWFVPTVLALFFNRKHLKLIFLANIPAGLSFIAWGACIVWAVSGKISKRLQSSVQQPL